MKYEVVLKVVIDESDESTKDGIAATTDALVDAVLALPGVVGATSTWKWAE